MKGRVVFVLIFLAFAATPLLASPSTIILGGIGAQRVDIGTDVSGSNSVGGFIGISYKSNVTGCFWDIQTSGLSNMCGSQDDESNRVFGSFMKSQQIPNTIEPDKYS